MESSFSLFQVDGYPNLLEKSPAASELLEEKQNEVHKGQLDHCSPVVQRLRESRSCRTAIHTQNINLTTIFQSSGCARFFLQLHWLCLVPSQDDQACTLQLGHSLPLYQSRFVRKSQFINCFHKCC